MAAIFAQHHCDTREAGQLYAAWRKGSPAIRKRILDDPELFFKTQRQAQEKAPAGTGAELLRDLEMVVAIVNRAQRRLAGAAATELDRPAMRKPRGSRSSAFKNNSIASTKKSYRRRNRMLSQAQRTTILELNTQGVSKREIARVLGISRVAVRKVLRSNSTAVPELQRTEKAEPYRQQILELFDQCKGNLVRVHEELVAGGAELSYTALTAFCRRHGIGYAPPAPAGQYDFAPGEEMQHDTSPHELELGGKKRKVQTASAVLCYSRMLFFQCYPTFRRFDCKVFLTDALRYFGGATSPRHDRQHARGGAARQRTRHGSGAGDGRLWRAFRLSVRGARDWQCQPFGARGAALLVHREQLPGRAHLLQLGGSESAGAGVVRQGQLDLQETYPRGSARAVRGRAAASEAAAGVDSGSLPAASAPGRYRRLCRAEQQPLLGSGGLDRPPRGGARDQGQDRDSTRCPPPGHAPAHRRSRAPASDAGRAPSAARPERRAARSASRREGHSSPPRPSWPTMSRG